MDHISQETESFLKGLDVAEQYFETHGRPMLERDFPFLADRAAAGLVGQGSECLGFDDRISRDHDYGPSFCLWLTREDYLSHGAQLQQAYERLPGEFLGLGARQTAIHGGGRVGVLCIPDFYIGLTGMDDIPKNWREWMCIPEYALASATNGKVFYDGLGEFSRIRKGLLEFYPEDVRIKKIAARAAVMAQSGQYNYARAMKRGEHVTAALALAEFVRHTISMVYLLNRRYAPFYKWMHHGMKTLPVLSETGQLLEQLVLTADQSAAWRGVRAEEYLYTLNEDDVCVGLIEKICSNVLVELKNQGLTEGNDCFLESHTASLMSRIRDPEIRALPVMSG